VAEARKMARFMSVDVVDTHVKDGKYPVKMVEDIVDFAHNDDKKPGYCFCVEMKLYEIAGLEQHLIFKVSEGQEIKLKPITIWIGTKHVDAETFKHVRRVTTAKGDVAHLEKAEVLISGTATCKEGREKLDQEGRIVNVEDYFVPRKEVQWNDHVINLTYCVRKRAE
jgi:hypothetical protein